MLADWLQNLLVLQERDLRCDTIQRQLDAIPADVAKEERAIAQLQADVEGKIREGLEMEARRKEIEGEVAQLEANIVRYKTQQLQVKKNEEYAALEKEIRNLHDHISELEDKELQLLEDADRHQQELAVLKTEAADQQHTLEAHIQRLQSSLASYQGELQEAKAELAESEAVQEPNVLQQYRYVKTQLKRPPIVVQLDQGRCMGCHLKVSGEVESEARRGHALVRCDSCGRILYLDR